MKKIASILLICLMTSCSNDFLELYPEDSLNEGNFYKSEVEFILLANGCYLPMRDYEKNQHWVLAELSSDNGTQQNNIRTGEASRGVIDQFILGSDNAAYRDFWNLSYRGITRCNKLLSELDREGVTFSKQSYKDRCAGEARFLRALYYFNLVRQFGGVPLVDKPITSQEAVNIQRATEDEIYALIIKDLQEAVTHFSKASDVEEAGRANQWAAQGMLGKVYLTRKQFTEAQQALSAVISAGKYQLLPSYADLFDPSKKDYKETIFAIQYSESSAEVANQFIFLFAPHTSGGAVTKRPNINIVGAGWNQPTDDLINAFEPGDTRKDVAIGYWTGLDWDNQVRPIPYCAKYKPPLTAPDNRAGDNLPVLRYADVLLMYAEVLNEQGKASEALPYVQLVRNRAGLTSPLSGLSKTELQDLIANERRVELCFENHRWYDLKRTGKAIEVMTAHGQREIAKKPYLYDGAYTLTPNKLLAPIPNNEILVNKLTQNPGY
ncbi:RagB/SusD family nutrient uptake outer membrane protein [Arundinibacter roseus]|uniref:RagB/SusD family nutrient uptake outer membrane protein n=1 Tax=Arundinibacter roseus TaxID=2070510 RepID=A0A4R4KMK5_9BACT|nr:RagB/SusD family nutrient uptake outer membrane protein [Arundinibacter roseus]TDB67899.1 RagB/SusD family nutrient uptake outer membrane protein [Arundinibacter roseus]